MNVYIESSVKSQKPKNGVVGFVLEDEKGTFTQFGTVSEVTENESFLKALKYALKKAPLQVDITIWSDSRYLFNAFSQGWLANWAKNDWKTAKGKPIANLEDWREVAERLETREITVRFKEEHSYKKWLVGEVERRAKKYV